METIRRVVGTMLLVTLLQATATAAATGDETAAGSAEEGGEKRCLPIASIRSTKVVDDQTIQFLMRGRPDYINHLPNRCPGLGFYKSFGYATALNVVCDLDIITVIETNRRGASCGLGKFVEFDPAAEEQTGDDEPDGGKSETQGP